MDALMKVRDEFEQERNVLSIALEEQVADLMGDRPINLNSPEQKSWVIYSRRPHDKKVWADLFDERMPDTEYRSTVRYIVNVCTNRRHTSAKSATAQDR